MDPAARKDISSYVVSSQHAAERTIHAAIMQSEFSRNMHWSEKAEFERGQGMARSSLSKNMQGLVRQEGCKFLAFMYPSRPPPLHSLDSVCPPILGPIQPDCDFGHE